MYCIYKYPITKLYHEEVVTQLERKREAKKRGLEMVCEDVDKNPELVKIASNRSML